MAYGYLPVPGLPGSYADRLGRVALRRPGRWFQVVIRLFAVWWLRKDLLGRRMAQR